MTHPLFRKRTKPASETDTHRDVRGVPIAKDRCDGYGTNHLRCIRQRGHSGRHVTSAEFRR